MHLRAIVLTCAFALGGCGGGSASGGGGGIIVVPGPAPTPAPVPAPTPAPAPSPIENPQALNCTVRDTVRQAGSVTIRPVAGVVTVVAIGSSSTAGNGASSATRTYPAVLQQLLAMRSDIASYVVYNKGIGGDTLAGTQSRLQRDVLDLRPQLVVLQAGTNDAIAGPGTASLADYTNRLRSVVATLKTQSAVLLVNGQHYPTEPTNYADYLNAMSLVAKEQNVALFDRYSLMKSWITTGTYNYSDILSSDRFHPNDLTYGCMAQVISELTVRTTLP